MEKPLMVSMVVLAVLVVNPVAMAEILYWDDGAIHTISDSTYQDDNLYLDFYTPNDPGTRIDLVSAGVVREFELYNNSIVNIIGGSVRFDFAAYDNSTIDISNGSVGDSLSMHDSAAIAMSGGTLDSFAVSDTATATISGGSINVYFVALENAAVTISGGSVSTALNARTNANIYLDGSGFEVDGTPLAIGDKLSDFGTFNGTYYTGLVTGTLADDSDLNNTFRIYNTGDFEGTADIIIVPEPATLILLALGAVVLRRKCRL